MVLKRTYSYIDLIGEVLQKGQVRSSLIRCINVDEARRVCKDRSRRRSLVSAYPHSKRREFMYVRMVFHFRKSVNTPTH